MSNQSDNENYLMLALPSAMQDSITEETSDILSNIAEIGLDAVMNDGFLKEVPILSTAVSLFKIGNSLRERHYVKKLASFVLDLNDGIAKDRARDYYKQKIIDDPKRRNKELEYILILIDRYLHANKPSLLAKLYLSYLDDYITWDDFTKYAEVVDRLMPDDFETLERIELNTYKPSKDCLIRVFSLGILEYIGEHHELAVKIEDGHLYDSYNEARYELTDFGRELKDIIFN